MRYADLWRAMKRYNYESDAWQEFVGAIGEQTDGRWPNEVAAAEAPKSLRVIGWPSPPEKAGNSMPMGRECRLRGAIRTAHLSIEGSVRCGRTDRSKGHDAF
jgi:hypothetical protein